MEQKRQNKQKRRAAFTLAEFLTVIAIVGILASLSFVAVIRYQRKLRRLEMDQTAKEIFLAAQNHLTLEVSNGTIPRLLHMEAQGEFSDDQKQAKLGISVENTVLAEEKEGNIYAVLYVSEKQAGQPGWTPRLRRTESEASDLLLRTYQSHQRSGYRPYHHSRRTADGNLYRLPVSG